MNSSNEVLARVVVDRARRSVARRDLLSFAKYVHPGFIAARHHIAIADALGAVASGSARVMVSMPPRHGKSLLCSVLFPAFYLGCNPDKQVIHVSYANSLSNEFSRQVREMLRDNLSYRSLFPAIQLSAERARIDDWKLATGGGFKSTGVGGGLTGHGADLLILDDPVKEGDERSPAALDQIFTWYSSAARTRLAPGGSILIIMTRWHPLDLIGRILAIEGEAWQVLTLPAISAEGRALWPERFSVEDLIRIRTLSESYFEALYQQNPTASTYELFRAADFQRGTSDDCSRSFWAFDLATSAGESADYSVFLRVCVADRLVYITQIIRFRAEWGEVIRRLMDTVTTFPADVYVFPRHTYELLAVQMLRERWPGVACEDIAQPGDKAERALAFANLVSAGRVVVAPGDEGDLFIDELVGFLGYAQHDDMVDAASLAAHYIGRPRFKDVV